MHTQWLMRTTEPYKIYKNGIKINGVDYYTSQFVQMQGKHKVYARFDPEDMSYVEVYDLQDRYLFKAHRTQSMSFNPTKEEYQELNCRKKEALSITKSGMTAPPEDYGTVSFIDKMMDLQIAENKKKGLVEQEINVPVKSHRRECSAKSAEAILILL